MYSLNITAEAVLSITLLPFAIIMRFWYLMWGWFYFNMLPVSMKIIWSSFYTLYILYINLSLRLEMVSNGVNQSFSMIWLTYYTNKSLFKRYLYGFYSRGCKLCCSLSTGYCICNLFSNPFLLCYSFSFIFLKDLYFILCVLHIVLATLDGLFTSVLLYLITCSGT